MTYREPKLHAGHMEVAVAKLIGWRQHTIVPNVSWGLGLRHEADMLVLDKSNRLTEVEIKISKSDLKADLSKRHGHASSIISRLVYAVPDDLVEIASQILPNSVGIISVRWDGYIGAFKAKWVRNCKHNKTRRPDDKQIIKMAQLGCMRIWSLKERLIESKYAKARIGISPENR